ncbi:MAG: flagellar biosynthesis protein [Sphingobium sp.]
MSDMSIFRTRPLQVAEVQAPRGGNGFRALFDAPREQSDWAARSFAAPEPVSFVPQVDPLEEASQQGFITGFQEGERVTREAMEADDTARADLAHAISQLGGMEEGTLASLLSQAVMRLVTQIVGEVPVDEDRLAERCAAIAACIDPDEGKAMLEVNPLDLPLIPDNGVKLVANAAIARGSVRLATSEGWIEDGPEVRLSRLQAALDDMEGRA